MTSCRLHILSWMFIAVTMSGCLFDSGSKRVVGRYIVLWIDQPENQSLSIQSATSASSSSEIILPYVFAVGHNDRFIIAKQHPTNGFAGGYKMDTTITHYYIIDIKSKSRDEDYQLYGPLTLAAFRRLSAYFNLLQLHFDLQYPDNIYPTVILPDSLRQTISTKGILRNLIAS
jgi:hypothetical protein